MRIYEGSPRQDWEDVLRSVGSYLDHQGIRGLVFLETDTGFIIQGTAVHRSLGPGEAIGQASRETLTLHDDDIGKFMDEAVARRGQTPDETLDHNESRLRVIGRYFDEHHPREVVFFEVEGAYIARLQVIGQGGLRQEILEFTNDDITNMLNTAPQQRRENQPKKG
jgi:hypothetical protein